MKRFINYLQEAARTRIAERVRITSDAELDKIATAASQKHSGSYILAYVDFGEATLFKTDRLPTNAYASDDWKAGYWRNGVRYKWSEARIAAAQRAVDRLSGHQ